MDNKKFEQLIELIINENEEQARALFHDIVVEKSREIYESMMDDEDGMEEGSMSGQVGDLMDEINADESGMTEDEEELEIDTGDDDEVVDIDADDEEGLEGEVEDLEDRVVDLEDKLDELMAEFEAIMGDEEGEEDFGDEEGEEDFGDEEALEEMMEAVELKKVPGLYDSKIGGDNGAQAKSPIGTAANAGQAGMASKPVKFAGDTETVPTSPKAPSNPYTKGEGQLKGAGSFKNVPGQKGQDLGKAPAPTKSQASGVNTKSPVAESAKKAPAKKAPAKKIK